MSSAGLAVRVGSGIDAAVDIRLLAPAELAELAPRLLSIQQQAYAIEAALLGDDRIPALHESLAELRGAGLSWLICSGVGLDASTGAGAAGIVGALGFTVADGTVDIDRLVVDPAYHRHGVGRALVRGVLGFGPHVVVSTGRANPAARALYAGLGFRHGGDREVLTGLWVSDYIRDVNNS